MSIPLLMHLLHDRLTWRLQPREPEPELVMRSPAQTSAFTEAGADGGVLAFLYLYNAVQISSLLQAGDRVLDLACGPANQLVQVARLRPDLHFTGLDASASMLASARGTLARASIRNVELLQGDMTRLRKFQSASMDVVTCTMSLHHLPDTAALHATMREVRRVLKPDGRVYFVDFGRLKRRSTQRFLADDLHQSAQFTKDYFHSLRAAFSVQELSAAVATQGLVAQCHATMLVPFMVVLCSAVRRPIEAPTQQRARAAFARLAPAQQRNFHNIAGWFRAGGYTLPCDLA